MPKKVTLELDDEIIAYLKFRKEAWDSPEAATIRRAIKEAMVSDMTYDRKTRKASNQKASK